MDDFVSTVPLLESAIAVLVWSWGVSPQQSLAALIEVAEDRAVDLGDLSALVLASELQRQADPGRSRGPSQSRSRRQSLVGVEVSSATALAPRAVMSSQAATSWSMRDPAQPGGVRSRRLAHAQASPAPATRVRQPPPPAAEPAALSWPGASFGLSRRECEIVALLALGLSNRQIAQSCYLSINSVKTYIRTAYRKMGVKSRTQALLWAVDHGLRPDVPAQPLAEPEPTLPRRKSLRGLPSLQQMG